MRPLRGREHRQFDAETDRFAAAMVDAMKADGVPVYCGACGSKYSNRHRCWRSAVAKFVRRNSTCIALVVALAVLASYWHRPLWLRIVFVVIGVSLLLYRSLYERREQKIAEAEGHIKRELTHTDYPLYALDLVRRTSHKTTHVLSALDRLEDRGEIEVEMDHDRRMYRLSE